MPTARCAMCLAQMLSEFLGFGRDTSWPYLFLSVPETSPMLQMEICTVFIQPTSCPPSTRVHPFTQISISYPHIHPSSIFSSTHPSFYPSTHHLSMHSPIIYIFVHLLTHLSIIYLLIHLFTYPSICLSICSSICPSVHHLSQGSYPYCHPCLVRHTHSIESLQCINFYV